MKTTTEDTKGSLSPYAKFHFTYLRWDFQEISTGKQYTKGEFWDCFRETAEDLIRYHDNLKLTVPTGFRLVRRPDPKLVGRRA